VDGVHPHWCVMWNGGGVCCCCPALSRVCGLCHPLPVQHSLLLRSCCALSVAGCVWCVVVCVVVCVVGYPLCAPPSRWWWVGPSWMVGRVLWWGGMVMEGRRCRWRPRLVCSVPLVEWRRGCAGVVSPSSHCPRFLALSRASSALWRSVCCGVGKCGCVMGGGV
jgi:hypothetical protein